MHILTHVFACPSARCQIDMMWRTHVLSSISTDNSDCKALMGCSFHHDDFLNDRTKDGILDLLYQLTKKIWLDEFGTEYVLDRVMY